MEELINDLNQLLKGRSNIIMKDELEAILKLYKQRDRLRRYASWYNVELPKIEQRFWDVKIDRPLANLDKSDGVIPTYVRKKLGKKIKKR